MREKDLLNKALLKISAETGATLFRNNVGRGWCGKVVSKRQTGDCFNIIMEKARPVQFGLFPGSSDLIGWQSLEITPEMVGKTIAVFTALEGKTKGVRTKKNQQNFINRVIESGGIAGVFRSDDQATELITAFPSTCNGRY